MKSGPFAELKWTTIDGVTWGPDDKPVLIADGEVFRIDDLDAPLAMVVGNRKPLLSSRDDVARMAKYEDAFSKLQAGFAEPI